MPHKSHPESASAGAFRVGTSEVRSACVVVGADVGNTVLVNFLKILPMGFPLRNLDLTRTSEVPCELLSTLRSLLQHCSSLVELWLTLESVAMPAERASDLADLWKKVSPLQKLHLRLSRSQLGARFLGERGEGR